MGTPGKTPIRFSKDQLIPDDVLFPPTLKKMILELSSENLESVSATVVRICTLHFNNGKKKYPHRIREKIIEYAIKERLNNKAHAIKKICQEYFEKNPLKTKITNKIPAGHCPHCHKNFTVTN